MKLLLQRSLFTGGSAALVASGFVLHGSWALSLLGLLLLLTLLGHSDKLSRKQFLWQCALFGYVYFGIVLRWVFNINAIDLIKDSFFAGFFIFLTYILMVGSFAVGFVMAGFLYRQLNISMKNKTILLVPALWILGEFGRSVFFSFFVLGDGGSIGPYWNFGMLGYSLMDSPMKYSSRIVGSTGLSFLFVLVAVTLYMMLYKKWKYAVFAVVPVIISVAGWYFYRMPEARVLNLATVGLNESVEGGYEDKLIKVIKEQATLDAVVLPEYSNIFLNGQGLLTSNTLPENVKLVIDSASVTNNDKLNNMVSFYTHDGKVLSQQQKSFLIPGGEYLPYVYHILLFYSGNRDLVHDFHDSRSVQKALAKERPYVNQGVSYGALACSGAIAPELYRSLARDGASVFANSASVAVLGVSGSYYGQADQIAQFISTANARPFVQAARGGPSYIMKADGTVAAVAGSVENSKVITAPTQAGTRRTIYTILGEWPVVASLAGLLIFLVTRILNSRKTS